MPNRPSCVSAPPATTGVPARRPVSAAASVVVDLLGGAASDQLCRLLARARVDVRAGPDLTSVRVVEDHSFAHARRADGGNVVDAAPDGVQRLTHAGADQLPVAVRVEHLG